MDKKKSTIHPLLLRQLKRANISEHDISPDKRDDWNELITRISRTYHDHEQDRYLLERSMELSSKELLELNEKLESAQHIAHLGYWLYDLENDQLSWSKEMYNLVGCDPSQPIPTMKEIQASMHEDDREKFIEMMEQVVSKGIYGEIELRFKNWKDHKYYWHFVKFQPQSVEGGNRTRYLSGVVMDITDRKESELLAVEANQKLVSISRQAGMAEVATSILHNIGNILNSANVSISILQENFSQNYYEKLFKVAIMIKENLHDIAHFFLHDQKGQLIPNYLVELIEILAKAYRNSRSELNNIAFNLTHIKDIIAMQQTISGTSSGVFEKIYIPEAIDTALQMAINGSKAQINIARAYEKVPLVLTDKSKLTQILVNLIQNAKDSVQKNPANLDKKISIFLKNKQDQIQIWVEDNGIGIPGENLDRIFSFGFTTKESGHGFGLHSSALAAKELGGWLRARSQGTNKGATFILALPINGRNK